MSRPLVVLRPEPGLAATWAASRDLGLETVASPLFAIEPVAWSAVGASPYDAILAGSANAFLHGGPNLDALRGLPVFAVGDRTADAAQAAGFVVERTGAGGLQSLLDGMVAPLSLLRLAGEDRVALDSAAGVEIDEKVVYRAVPLALGAAAVAVLRSGAAALLHSASAAQRFVMECERLAIDRRRIAIAALAPRIAAAAGSGWEEVRVAPAITDSALLAMAADMCQ
jgi:uroporphyrinogen-III synthase